MPHGSGCAPSIIDLRLLPQQPRLQKYFFDDAHEEEYVAYYTSMYLLAEADRLFGDAVNDQLTGGAGTDRCNGGSGADTATTCETKISIPLSVLALSICGGGTILPSSAGRVRVRFPDLVTAATPIED